MQLVIKSDYIPLEDHDHQILLMVTEISQLLLDPQLKHFSKAVSNSSAPLDIAYSINSNWSSEAADINK